MGGPTADDEASGEAQVWWPTEEAPTDPLYIASISNPFTPIAPPEEEEEELRLVSSSESDCQHQDSESED